MKAHRLKAMHVTFTDVPWERFGCVIDATYTLCKFSIRLFPYLKPTEDITCHLSSKHMSPA